MFLGEIFIYFDDLVSGNVLITARTTLLFCFQNVMLGSMTGSREIPAKS